MSTEAVFADFTRGDAPRMVPSSKTSAISEGSITVCPSLLTFQRMSRSTETTTSVLPSGERIR